MIKIEDQRSMETVQTWSQIRFMGKITTPLKSSVKVPSSEKVSKVLQVIPVSVLSILVQFCLGESGPTVRAEQFTKKISLHDKFPTLPKEECKGILS